MEKDTRSETIEQARQAVRPYLLDYLEELGITPNRENKIHCLNPNHDDHDPSMSLDKAKTDGFAHCFSCDATYDIIRLYEQNTGKDYLSSLKDLSRKYLHKDLDLGGAEAPAKALEGKGNSEAITYLQGRGIAHAKEIVEMCRIKSDSNAIYFPRYENMNTEREWVASMQSRAIRPTAKGDRYRRSKGKSLGLYDPLMAFSWPTEGLNLIAVTEGEIDALSIMEAIAQDKAIKVRPVALSGASMLGKFEEALEGLRGDPKRYGFLILTDKDQAGDSAAKELAKILEDKGYAYIDARGYPQGAKDPNDWLQMDAKGFAKHLEDIAGNFLALTDKGFAARQKEAEDYDKKYSASSAVVSLLADIYSKEDKDPIKTGFRGLDDLLGGEMERGLVLLGAPSSLGKTTLMLQIADQIAYSDRRDILYFSLEQSREELVAKSVSRLSFLLDEGDSTAKTTLGIMQKSQWRAYSDDEIDAIMDAFTAYNATAGRLYFRTCPVGGLSVEDISKAVQEHERATGRAPVVFIDYLQAIRPLDNARTDRQAVDMNISALKRLSASANNGKGIVVFVISSLSRAYYYEQATLEAFKESGGIEYGADYALGLAYDWLYTDEADKPDPKYRGDITKYRRDKINELRGDETFSETIPIRLTILKHRNGVPNRHCRLMFAPAYNCFSEIEEGKNGEEQAALTGLRSMASKALAKGKEILKTFDDPDDNTPF